MMIWKGDIHPARAYVRAAAHYARACVCAHDARGIARCLRTIQLEGIEPICLDAR